MGSFTISNPPRKCGMTRFITQIQGQGPRLQGMLGPLIAPQNRVMATPSLCPAAPAMVLALDGSQSQLVVSTQSKAPDLQLAARSSCTLGHSSDTA